LRAKEGTAFAVVLQTNPETTTTVMTIFANEDLITMLQLCAKTLLIKMWLFYNAAGRFVCS
jgi:hypothetical protein